MYILNESELILQMFSFCFRTDSLTFEGINKICFRNLFTLLPHEVQHTLQAHFSAGNFAYWRSKFSINCVFVLG